MQPQPVNVVQWGAVSDQDAAQFVVDRLAYLTWGSQPNPTGPAQTLPLTGPGLDEPLSPSRLRVLLLTPARDRTGFGFRDPLTAIAPAAAPRLFRDLPCRRTALRVRR
ncbi:MAG: hypothetical protein U5O69_01275 [Candidatus Competibacteraceae bacterium]|nr:hypothetical protein [Candidatus Competibacteraceae bacterium]